MSWFQKDLTTLAFLWRLERADGWHWGSRRMTVTLCAMG
jgi:hypothetical protein